MLSEWDELSHLSRLFRLSADDERHLFHCVGRIVTAELWREIDRLTASGDLVDPEKFSKRPARDRPTNHNRSASDLLDELGDTHNCNPDQWTGRVVGGDPMSGAPGISVWSCLFCADAKMKIVKAEWPDARFVPRGV